MEEMEEAFSNFKVILFMQLISIPSKFKVILSGTVWQYSSQAHNDSKNIFKAANTPITIFIMWSVLYIFSQVGSNFSEVEIGTDLLQVSSLLMLYPLANLANLLMWGLTFLGATWAYAKYRYT